MIFLLCSAALAATPTLLPGAPLQAGQPGLVDLWIPGLSQGARIKASTPDGHVERPVQLPDGRVQVSVIPGDSSSLSLLLRVRSTAGREESTVIIPVVPATAGGLVLHPTQAPVPPGASQGVDLVLRSADGQDPPRGDHLLLTRSSLGTVKAPVHDDNGWTLHWKPPAHLDQPAYAIIAVADSATPGSRLGWAALPVMAMATIDATVDPGAHCTLTTSSLSADPVTVDANADPTGQITFQLPLHPAVARGDLSCQTDTRTFERAISLPAGRHPWLGWLPPPTVVPAGAQVPVQIAVVNDDGAPRTVGTAPTVLASAGSVTELELVGPGLAQGLWTAPQQPGTVRLVAKLLDQQVETTVQVSAALPALQVSAEPTELPQGERITKLSITGAEPTAVWTSGLRAGRLLVHQGVGAVSLDLAPDQAL
ncbi:MAG: hypothetical protein GXP62_18265, partial [Oligoflexia bacterium]|nr:hypothetical protein [Oligoflexia bacterium]